MDEPTVFHILMKNEAVGRLARLWFLCFALALTLPLLGHERIWILAAPAFALLLLNVYIQLLYSIQLKKSLLDKKSLAVPKFFMYAGNAFFTFTLLPLAALTLIPGALEEMGAYPVEPLSSTAATTGFFIWLACFALTAFGALLSVVRGRQLIGQIEADSEDVVANESKVSQQEA